MIVLPSHLGPDQELHDDVAEGGSVSPWKINNAQGKD